MLDIGANHGLFALFAALRGARVAAVEAQATLASVVKVATLANGVDVDVFHNAILDVPAVVEIAELGASNDYNEGGTASLGAARGGRDLGRRGAPRLRTPRRPRPFPRQALGAVPGLAGPRRRRRRLRNLTLSP